MSFNNFEESSPAPIADSQIQQTQPQIPPAPVAQLGGNDFLAPLPIPNPPNATASTSSSPPRTLWMGDLDPWSDEEAIEKLWETLGKRVLVKLIKAKRGTPAANLNTGHAGYCFVEFENYEEAKSALALNGSQIPNTNRLFRLNWASGATLSSPIPQSPEFSLFVGDLAPSTTEAHLLALFQSHFKSVKTVRVMTDPITGTSRCFGFVRFSDEEERHRALTEMSGVWCAGRPLRVALATPRNQSNGMIVNAMNQFQPSQFPGQFVNQQQQPQEMVMYPYQQVPPTMPFFDEQPQVAPPPQQVPPPQVQPTAVPFSDPNNTTVFVGGLAAGVTDNLLANLFSPFGPIVHIKIPQNKGCGFIRFENREDAVNAINAMQGFSVGGSRIRLSWGRQQNQQRLAMAMMNGSSQPQLNQLNLQTNGFNIPANNIYYMPNDKPLAYDQFGLQEQFIQPMEYRQEEEKEITPERSDDVEDGSKLQEMYRAAVAGKLDSLN